MSIVTNAAKQAINGQTPEDSKEIKAFLNGVVIKLLELGYTIDAAAKENRINESSYLEIVVTGTDLVILGATSPGRTYGEEAGFIAPVKYSEANTGPALSVCCCVERGVRRLYSNEVVGKPELGRIWLMGEYKDRRREFTWEERDRFVDMILEWARKNISPEAAIVPAVTGSEPAP